MINRIEISEKAFFSQVEDLLKRFQWEFEHTFEQGVYARRTTKGFPDIVACRPPRLLFIELKSERGKVTEAQQEWLDALKATGKVEVYLWKPSQFEEIVEILR